MTTVIHTIDLYAYFFLKKTQFKGKQYLFLKWKSNNSIKTEEFGLSSLTSKYCSILGRNMHKNDNIIKC